MLKIVNIFILLMICQSVLAETVFTYREKESDSDTRYEYDRKLLELALIKTEKKYGSYKLVPSAAGANESRAQIDAESNRYENFFFKQSVTPELLEKFAYVPFPIDRGIVGYRIAFVSKETKQRLKSVKTLDDLKDFTFLQGTGWNDIEILKENGLKVITEPYYESLFKMSANNRADLFTRGANELLAEWKSHQHINNLRYDETLVIHYLMPRFLFTTKTNTEAVKRVQEGIMLAYNDGSLIKLWQQEYGESIEFSALNKRQMIKLENPFIQKLDRSFLQYNYDPFE